MRAFFARLWRRRIADEDPEEKRKRILLDRIEQFKRFSDIQEEWNAKCAQFLEQMKQWNLDRRK